jgi:hypothetical protein
MVLTGAAHSWTLSAGLTDNPWEGCCAQCGGGGSGWRGHGGGAFAVHGADGGSAVMLSMALTRVARGCGAVRGADRTAHLRDALSRDAPVLGWPASQLPPFSSILRCCAFS